MQIRVEDAELLTDYQRKRKEYRERNRLTGSREAGTMERMKAFRSIISSAAPRDAEPDQATTSEGVDAGPAKGEEVSRHIT